MAENAVSAFTASLDPRPPLPSPNDMPNNGACNGIDGDPDGQDSIVWSYDLGAVPVGTSDAWFDQAQRFWASNDYEVTLSSGAAGEVESRRRMSAQRRSTGPRLGLERLPRALGGAVKLIVVTECLADPPTEPGYP